MDPRHIHTHAFGAPSDEENKRPTMWRYWRALPPKGKIGIFFGSWYTDPIVHRVYGSINEAELAQPEKDWCNREKWDDYEVSVCDMIDRTSTDYAPWTIIEANDKNHARIKVLKTVCDRIKDAL